MKRHIIFMIIAKKIIGVVTNLTDRLPRFKESRGNISMYKRVKEFEIRYSNEVSERENRESCLKRGSVWSLYFLLVIILIADFCLEIRGCKREGDADDQISIA
jgi:hypothetical protein